MSNSLHILCARYFITSELLRTGGNDSFFLIVLLIKWKISVSKKSELYHTHDKRVTIALRSVDSLFTSLLTTALFTDSTERLPLNIGCETVNLIIRSHFRNGC